MILATWPGVLCSNGPWGVRTATRATHEHAASSAQHPWLTHKTQQPVYRDYSKHAHLNARMYAAAVSPAGMGSAGDCRSGDPVAVRALRSLSFALMVKYGTCGLPTASHGASHHLDVCSQEGQHCLQRIVGVGMSGHGRARGIRAQLLNQHSACKILFSYEIYKRSHCALGFCLCLIISSWRAVLVSQASSHAR